MEVNRINVFEINHASSKEVNRLRFIKQSKERLGEQVIRQVG
jgi:hypothetical protein